MRSAKRGTLGFVVGWSLLLVCELGLLGCAGPLQDAGSAPPGDAGSAELPSVVPLDPGAEGGSEPPGEQKDGYFEAQVFFGTDRPADASAPFGYGLARGDGTVIYGRAQVSIPDSHEIGELEAPPRWKFWDRENPTKYVVLLGTSTFAEPLEFGGAVRALLADAGRDDVLIFLHGYNTSFEDAARRTAQLAYDLKFPGVPMFFSWPSRAEEGGYPADEATVEWSAPHFGELLRLALTGVGARKVHVIAHSMGNRALIDVLRDFDPSSLPPGSAELRQVILAAPDIDADRFKQLAPRFTGKASRTTLYVSSEDKAIILSRGFHDDARAGGEVTIVDGIDTVDASQVRTSFLGHSYFGSSILPDITDLIARDWPPGERLDRLRERSHEDGRYWEYLPAESP